MKKIKQMCFLHSRTGPHIVLRFLFCASFQFCISRWPINLTWNWEKANFLLTSSQQTVSLNALKSTPSFIHHNTCYPISKPIRSHLDYSTAFSPFSTPSYFFLLQCLCLIPAGNILQKGKSDVKFLRETSQQLSYHPDKIPTSWSGVKTLEDLVLMCDQPCAWPLQRCISAAVQLVHCSHCNESLTKYRVGLNFERKAF